MSLHHFISFSLLQYACVSILINGSLWCFDSNAWNSQGWISLMQNQSCHHCGQACILLHLWGNPTFALQTPCTVDLDHTPRNKDKDPFLHNTPCMADPFTARPLSLPTPFYTAPPCVVDPLTATANCNWKTHSNCTLPAPLHFTQMSWKWFQLSSLYR